MLHIIANVLFLRVCETCNAVYLQNCENVAYKYNCYVKVLCIFNVSSVYSLDAVSPSIF